MATGDATLPGEAEARTVRIKAMRIESASVWVRIFATHQPTSEVNENGRWRSMRHICRSLTTVPAGVCPRPVTAAPRPGDPLKILCCVLLLSEGGAKPPR